MSASRKLYVELAATIRRHVDVATIHQPADLDPIRPLVYDLAADLKQDNPSFDRLRFLTACGLS